MSNKVAQYKAKLEEWKKAREAATQGEWKFYLKHFDEEFPSTAAFSQIAAYDDKNKTGVVMCRLGVPDKICMEQTDADFICIFANHWTELIDAQLSLLKLVDDMTEGFEGHFGESFWESNLGLNATRVLERICGK